MKDLEHKIALQEKDLEIKNLELQQERSKAVQQHPVSPSPSSDPAAGCQDYNDDDDDRSCDDDY